jgi:hypothetical protein
MDPTPEAWRSLRARIEDRARALADEGRAYPTPIARCDEQLPGLIARRTEAFAALREIEALERERESLSEARWRERATALMESLATRP